MKLPILLISIFFISSCANYGAMCDATKINGWRHYKEPTPEMITVLGKQQSEGGKIIWFKNIDGRIRVCDFYPKYNCVANHATYNPSEPALNEVMISSCPNPY